MKSATFLPLALLAAVPAALAHPRNPNHNTVHDKRSVVIYTEMVVVTEVVEVTSTVWIDENETPQTQAPAVDTAPQTTLLGPETVEGGVFVEKASEAAPQPSSSKPSQVAPVAPSVTTPVTTVAIPTSVAEASVEAPVASVAPTSSEPEPSVASSSSQAASSQPESSEPQPSESQSSTPAPSSGGGGGGGSNLYSLALPPSQKDRTSMCGSGSPCKGKASFYGPMTNEMSCGYDNMVGQDNSMRIAAVPAGLMGGSSNSNGPGLMNQPTNGNCGRMIQVKCPSTGATTTVQAVDKCPGCPAEGLDLSYAAFDALGVHQDKGIVDIEWSFLN